MPPKKEPNPRGYVFTETERALYDLQIADLNRKLARLKTAVSEYEIRNEELQASYNKLDEDRADIIAYLKKTLNLRTDENTELKDRVKGLEELREIETAEFHEKVTVLEKNFTTMKDQLTSENKLLAGKLNALEEFRAIKEDLMRKFEKQEQDFKDQEMKYKRIIYDAEKKFVIGKDKLKKEMEARLLQLAQDFQDASETRIAASTHRVIRENIALNNQLDSLLYTQAKVTEQSEKFREDERAARNALEIAEAERDKAINKSIVQLKVIDQLTTAFQTTQKDKAIHEKQVAYIEHLQAKVQTLSNENQNMLLQLRILEQNVHATLGMKNKFIVDSAKLVKERDKYIEVIKDTICAIQSALKYDKWALTDSTREVLERKVVLKKILDVVNTYRQAIRADSMESLISFSDVYEKGDLGFVPKSTKVAAMRKRKSSVLISQSQESIDVKRASPESLSVSLSPIESLKTLPSISILPPLQEIPLPHVESIASFTVTSLHSSPSVSDTESLDIPHKMTDVEKQLAMSKLEIQKSILQDLLTSQTGGIRKSQMELDTTRSKLSLQSKHRLSRSGLLNKELEEVQKGEGEEKRKRGSNERRIEFHEAGMVGKEAEATKDVPIEAEKEDSVNTEEKTPVDTKNKKEELVETNKEDTIEEKK